MSEPERLMDGRPYDAKYGRTLLAILAVMALMVTYVETMVLPAFKQFYIFFDQTGGNFSTIAWILSAYLLVGVVVTPIFGKLGDLYGKKRMLVLVMGVYAVAVSVAGFTPNIGQAFGVSRPDQIFVLIGVRAVQGVGMAMFPLAFSMIPEVFPARRVGQAQGIVAAMFAAGASLGLVGGGYLAQTYGWQATYHTVIPIAVGVLILAILFLRESSKHANPSIDFPGVASLGFGLATLMFAISQGSTWGWADWSATHWGALTWGVPEFFVLALLGFVFFAWWEPRAKNPVVHFAAMKPRNIWVSNLNGVIAGLLMFLVFTTETVLIELPFGPGFNQTELQMGLVALPSTIGMLIFGPFLGRAIGTRGPKPIMALGFALSAIGAVALLAFNRSLIDLVAFPILLLVGNVAVLISMTNAIVLTADRKELGSQTGMNQTFRNLGSSIAPVLVTTILASFLATYYTQTPVGPVAFQGYALEGFRVVFAVTAALSVAGFLLSLALRNFKFSADGTRQTTEAPALAPTRVAEPAGLSATSVK
ncbi:MAG: MFS transporter [Thermoplasmata archaeon]|nr:MFS transporter [Thermoplasmata archaeon]MCI4361674.1 MFS transporter [Thermoplasmata archaeon]